MSRDEADKANEEIDHALSIALMRRKTVLVRKGECYCCGEQLTPQLLFCDADCAKLYEDMERFKAVNR